ncbi:beta-1,3-galactosyltransferase 5-like [Diadema antillarum]|uniref:beta-1,3-galactosyltransferase 5-like n=1 Tax=Diadema antillarum TaxID=105358 RepID=UPI003A88F02A
MRGPGLRCCRRAAPLFIFAFFFTLGFNAKYISEKHRLTFIPRFGRKNIEREGKTSHVAAESSDGKRSPADTVGPHSFIKPKESNDKKQSEQSEQETGILARQKWEPFKDRHDFPYIFNNRAKCFNTKTNTFDKLTLIVVIASKPDHFEQRNIMRLTWIKHTMENAYAVRVVFLLGLPSENNVQHRIKHESMLHGDIVQESFLDTYLNLTVKTIGALKWASRSCPRAKYFMKLDDDVMVDIGNLTGFLELRAEKSGYFGGILHENATAIRSPREKWFVPDEIYPLSTYPPYAEGKAYILSMDVVKKVLRISSDVAVFPWEDIYVGLCAKQVGIAPRDILSFHFMWDVRNSTNGRLIKTAKSLRKLNIMYIAYDLNTRQMLDVWKAWKLNSWD